MSTLSVKAPALRLRKRTFAIGLSLLLAAGATASLITYVRGVENRAASQAASIPAFVAKSNIAAGTSAEAAIAGGAFQSTLIPRRLLAAGAVTSLANLAGKVAAVDIVAGEQILASRFVSTLDRPTLLPIPEGHQAFTVQADLPNSVGGFVQPGDRVSVIAQVNVTGRSSTQLTHYLVQDVQVLAVGQTIARPGGTTTTADKKTTTTSSSTTLTLAVTPSEAEKLAFAVLTGDVYFTLVPNGQRPVSTSGRSSATIFN